MATIPMAPRARPEHCQNPGALATLAWWDHLEARKDTLYELTTKSRHRTSTKESTKCDSKHLDRQFGAVAKCGRAKQVGQFRVRQDEDKPRPRTTSNP